MAVREVSTNVGNSIKNQRGDEQGDGKPKISGMAIIPSWYVIEDKQTNSKSSRPARHQNYDETKPKEMVNHEQMQGTVKPLEHP